MRSRFLAAGLGAFLCWAGFAVVAHALSYTWDGNTGTTGIQDGSGDWDTSLNWWNGSADIAWPNLTTDEAIFGGGDAGTAGIITVGTRTANKITFNTPFAGSYTLSGGTVTLGGTTPTVGGPASAAISSGLSGTAGLVKTGAGTLTLSGANNFTGGTRVEEGTLKMGSASSLPSAAVTVIATTSTPVLDLGGFSFTVGAVNVGLNATVGSKGSITNGTLTATSYGAVGGNISAILAGSSAAFTKYNNGTVVLSGLNTYGGTTTIFKDVVSINSIHNADGSTASALGAPSAANGTIGMGNTSNTGILRYTGSATTTDRAINLRGTTGGAEIQANGSGALVFTGGVGATGAGAKTFTLSGTNKDVNEIRGVIAENSSVNKTSLIKSDVGTWALGGNNTYTGTTTVNGGRLEVNGSHAGAGDTAVGLYTVNNGGTLAGHGLIHADVNVASGGTLSGTGTVLGAVTVASGAKLDPGNSPGVLTLSGLDISSVNGNGGLRFDIGNTTEGQYDRVDVLGGLNLGTLIWDDCQFVLTQAPIVGDQFQLFTMNSFTGDLDASLANRQGTLTFGATTYQGELAMGTGNKSVVLNVIPEPSAVAMLLLGAVGLAMRRRFAIQQ